MMDDLLRMYRALVPAEFFPLEMALLGLVVLLFVRWAMRQNDPEPLYESERFFTDPVSKEKVAFASLLDDEATKTLSVVIPAYNEEERMPIMLEETLEYLEGKCKEDKDFSYELIIVDDGSKDKTSQVGQEHAAKYTTDKIRVLTLHHNRGKGGAVRLGSLRARGEYLLFADADGATRFSDLDGLMKVLVEFEKEGLGVVVGSRNHLKEKAKAQRKWHRNLMMYVFNALVRICVSGIHDTQCGFKLMTRKSAQLCYPSMHVNGWSFDVELLFVAQCKGMPVHEVPVNWQEIPGSKLITGLYSLLRNAVHMALDILKIRLMYLFGLWRFRS